ncbi:hypothetical protein SAMN02745126_04982 [Enhydrobacter aerosaccus]|uniref:Lipoprotein n=1 Tax=Enhydrobacter aerosaccus TaxID=225324 RepID=A0A1T4SQV4_9HYPH|nr:hypothetical protein [Enhydrobacter aerosaccus]SKA30543.1 hypothetical protein SAMN02745126_04982 [Enhydrobacter aerosaccus]
MRTFVLPLACIAGLSGCSLNDSRLAHQAQSGLVGFSERDLDSCLGVPNRRAEFGQTTILSYDGASSTSSGGIAVTLPIVGGISFSGGGYCHIIARLENGRVASIRYNGEKDATAAPDAYCAPLVRACFVRVPVRSLTTRVTDPQPTPPAEHPAASP